MAFAASDAAVAFSAACAAIWPAEAVLSPAGIPSILAGVLGVDAIPGFFTPPPPALRAL